MGAFVLWAWATRLTMRASTVPSPTSRAVMVKVPVVFSVAPINVSPGTWVTGMGSPVSMDSSTSLPPSFRMPSTGIFSPGFTLSTSPGWTSFRGMSLSTPLGSTRCAVEGARFISDLMASAVRDLAFNSRTCPSRLREMMMAAAS